MIFNRALEGRALRRNLWKCFWGRNRVSYGARAQNFDPAHGTTFNNHMIKVLNLPWLIMTTLHLTLDPGIHRPQHNTLGINEGRSSSTGIMSSTTYLFQPNYLFQRYLCRRIWLLKRGQRWRHLIAVIRWTRDPIGLIHTICWTRVLCITSP